MLVEGLHALNDQLTGEADLKVFADVSPKVQKDRWYHRIQKRNPKLCREAPERVDTLFKKAITAHRQHVQTTKQNAQIVINADQDIDTIRAGLKKLSTALVKVVIPIPTA